MALTSEQRKVLRQIQAAPSYARASPKVRKALIEAALVESNLSTPNQAQSDRDSEGVLQQRPSTGWGPTSESNTTDAEQFLRRAMALRTKYGNAGALAQAVQHSAFPGRYNQRGGEAAALIGRALGGSTGGTSRGRGSSGSSGSSTRTTTTTTPGVDNRAARASLIQSFLEDKSSDPVDFAVQARSLQDIAPTSTTKTVRTAARGSSGASRAGSSQQESDLASFATERANKLDAKHFHYQWGGGHGGKISDISKAVPVDCSGAVSAVLGIDPRVSGQFGKWGRPGDGGGSGVTIYSNGHHVLMKINGHFFGTSGSNPGGGAGWIPAGAISKDYLKGFTVRHSNR